MTRQLLRRDWVGRLFFLAVIAALLVSLGLAVYHSFVRWQGNRFDLYPRWVGVEAMFRESLSPYSEEVALRSQIGIYGHPARPEEGESAHHFLYPAFIAFTIPHLWLPFPLAITTWIVTELVMLGLIAIMMASCLKRRLHLWQLGLVTLALAAFRYNILSLGLGQFTIFVLFFLILAWWLWEQQHSIWSGVALTQAIVKPQLVFLTVPLWLVLALVRKRWAFVIGFVGCLAILLLLPWPFIGNWWTDFLNPPDQYSRSAGAKYLTDQAAAVLQLVLSTTLWPLAAWVWLRISGLRVRRWAIELGGPPAFPYLGYALALTTAIILVTTPRIRGYDLSMATLPLGFLILAHARRGWRTTVVQCLAWLTLLVVPWVFTLSTTPEQAESTERLVIGPITLALVLAFPAVRRVVQNE